MPAPVTHATDPMTGDLSQTTHKDAQGFPTDRDTTQQPDLSHAPPYTFHPSNPVTTTQEPDLSQAPPYTFRPSHSFVARAAQTAEVVGSRVGETLQYGAEKLGMKEPSATTEKVEREAGILPASIPSYVTPTIDSTNYNAIPKKLKEDIVASTGEHVYGLPLPKEAGN